MKRFILFSVLLVTIFTTTQAQRMIPKQKAVSINSGLLLSNDIQGDWHLGIDLVHYFNRGNYWLWAVEYNRMQFAYRNYRIPSETYLAEAGHGFRLLGDKRKTLQLNAALTGIAGYESINRGNALLHDGAVIQNSSGFVYGAGGRLSLETFLTDHFVLMLQTKARMLWSTSLQQFRPSVGLGLRFNF